MEDLTSVLDHSLVFLSVSRLHLSVSILSLCMSVSLLSLVSLTPSLSLCLYLYKCCVSLSFSITPTSLLRHGLCVWGQLPARVPHSPGASTDPCHLEELSNSQLHSVRILFFTYILIFFFLTGSHLKAMSPFLKIGHPRLTSLLSPLVSPALLGQVYSTASKGTCTA